MNVTVQEKECWVCGKTKKLTMHHTIPQHLNPAKNVIVPVCTKCHGEINKNDVAGLYSFAYKLNKRLEQIQGEVRAFTSLLENLTLDRIKKKTRKSNDERK